MLPAASTIQDQLDKHLAAVTAMLASAKPGNGKQGGCWQGNCKRQSQGNGKPKQAGGKQADGTIIYTYPQCTKC